MFFINKQYTVLRKTTISQHLSCVDISLYYCPWYIFDKSKCLLSPKDYPCCSLWVNYFENLSWVLYLNPTDGCCLIVATFLIIIKIHCHDNIKSLANLMDILYSASWLENVKPKGVSSIASKPPLNEKSSSDCRVANHKAKWLKCYQTYFSQVLKS